jgi:hypothetical protein
MARKHRGKRICPCRGSLQDYDASGLTLLVAIVRSARQRLKPADTAALPIDPLAAAKIRPPIPTDPRADAQMLSIRLRTADHRTARGRRRTSAFPARDSNWAVCIFVSSEDCCLRLSAMPRLIVHRVQTGPPNHSARATRVTPGESGSYSNHAGFHKRQDE